MICLISFDSWFSVVGWSILGVLLLIALIVALRIISRKRINAKIGDKEISLTDYRDKQEIEKTEHSENTLNEHELQLKLNEILDLKENLDAIPIECLKEQMNVVSRYNNTMNLQMKESYSILTEYTEGSAQWRYYCIFLLGLVKIAGAEFCEKFLQENHIAEKSDADYLKYCLSKKDEGWNITKDIISQYYEDNLLTVSRLEYFQKAGQQLRQIYDRNVDGIMIEVREIALKYQEKADGLNTQIKDLQDSLILQCEG